MPQTIEEKREYQRQWRAANREAHNAKARIYQKKSRAADPLLHRARAKTWREKNKERHKTNHLNWRSANREHIRAYARNRYDKEIYGLTPEKKLTIMANQHNCCAICEKQKKLVVDHDHETSKVRGLLCHNCNTGLGRLGDNERGLERALAYVRGC